MNTNWKWNVRQIKVIRQTRRKTINDRRIKTSMAHRTSFSFCWRSRIANLATMAFIYDRGISNWLHLSNNLLFCKNLLKKGLFLERKKLILNFNLVRIISTELSHIFRSFFILCLSIQTLFFFLQILLSLLLFCP